MPSCALPTAEPRGGAAGRCRQHAFAETRSVLKLTEFSILQVCLEFVQRVNLHVDYSEVHQSLFYSKYLNLNPYRGEHRRRLQISMGHALKKKFLILFQELTVDDWWS